MEGVGEAGEEAECDSVGDDEGEDRGAEGIFEDEAKGGEDSDGGEKYADEASF